MVPSLSAWGGLGANYFARLSPTGVSSSCALTGPCYPVLTTQANVWHTCQPQSLSNLPLSSAGPDGLAACFGCCEQRPVAASCNATDATGVRTVFGWGGATGANASANAKIGCFASCQSLHGSVASFSAATVGSIYPPALALFNATCAAAGFPAAAVPTPGVSDGGAMAAVVGALTASYKSTALRYANDLLGAWKALVVTGLFLPFAMALLWVFLMRLVVGPIVWLTVFVVDAACAGVTLYCFSKAGALNKNAFTGIVTYSESGGFSFNASAVAAATNTLTTTPGSGTAINVTSTTFDVNGISKREMYDAGIAAAIATALVWVFTLIIIPRLRVAIATIKVAADALRTVPLLAVFPLVPGFALACYMVWWVAVAAYIYSSGAIVKRDCCAEVQQAFTSLFPTYGAGAPSCSSIHCGYYVKLNRKLEYTLIVRRAEGCLGAASASADAFAPRARSTMASRFCGTPTS